MTVNRSHAEGLRDLRVVDLTDELPIAQVLARLAGMFAMTATRRESSEVGISGLRAHGDLRSPEVQRAGAAVVAALLVGCSSQASGMAADPLWILAVVMERQGIGFTNTIGMIAVVPGSTV